jgi:hypothetical protein
LCRYASEDNPLMLPIPDPCKDVVKRDIDDIPRILHAIQEDWKEPGMNRMSAWTLAGRLACRFEGCPLVSPVS